VQALAPADAAKDAFAWLEAIDGEQALAWVNAQTNRTLRDVRAMAGYAQRLQHNLRLGTQREFNIQYPSSVGGLVYNHFRSASQPAGVWRSTTLEEYRKDRPDWRTLLSLDDYNRQQGVDWVYGGSQVLPAALAGEARQGSDAPLRPRALIRLSRGGSDAAVFREFDTASRRFIPASEGGFELPEAKGFAAWWGKDALLVSSAALGPDTQTTSGYARELRLLRRGQALAEAQVLFRAETTDVSLDWRVDHRPGHAPDLVITRRLQFSQFMHHLWDGQSARKLDLPSHVSLRVAQGHLTLQTGAAWTINGRDHAAGSFFILPVAAAFRPALQPRLLFEPRDGDSVLGFAFTRDHVALNELRDLQSRVSLHRLDGGAPPREVQGLGEFGLSGLWTHEAAANLLWLQHRSFLEPNALYLLDAQTGQTELLHRQGAAGDASPYSVQRQWAVSKDGTRIPLTLIARKGAKADGKQPTLLYGYGGFGISTLPEYQRLVLTNWLEQGGTYAIAHIRGGGDLGPAWELAARGTKRQTGYDDFIAAAEHLIRSGITSPRHLGIYGASNGGLLTAAVSMQRPELFGAVVSRVPLTDLQRYTQWLAGPSWVQEYGDPAKAEDWAVMKTYSPYHNIRPGRSYPPTLYMGNRNDDRVHPIHGRKMAARLMAQTPSQVWYSEPISGGHSGTVTPQLAAEREALLYTFLMHHLAPP
jgi:prolyl oligopeptidase